MARAARQEQDPLLSARQALEEGRGLDGTDAIRQAVVVSGSAPTYDQALRLAVEFNLVSLARELAEAAVSRYPRDAKLKRLGEGAGAARRAGIHRTENLSKRARQGHRVAA